VINWVRASTSVPWSVISREIVLSTSIAVPALIL
jgi:hypothetical protein